MNKKFSLIISLLLFIILIYNLKVLIINQSKNQILLDKYKNLEKEVKGNEIVIKNKDLIKELNKINDFFGQKNISIDNLNYIKKSEDKNYILLEIEFCCNLNMFLDTMIFLKNEDYNIFNIVANKEIDDFNFVLEAKTDYEKIK